MNGVVTEIYVHFFIISGQVRILLIGNYTLQGVAFNIQLLILPFYRIPFLCDIFSA